MSILINKDKCICCNSCSNVCPGNLIYTDENNKAFIKYPQDCWGCAACVKECNHEAIEYHLPLDLGDNGYYLTTISKKDKIIWKIYNEKGENQSLETNKNESNKY